MAMNCATFGAGGAIQIVVDRVDEAKKVLDTQHLPYTEHDVLYVELDNSPGCLGEFAGKLAARGINVTTGYGIAKKGSHKASLILSVSDIDVASKID